MMRLSIGYPDASHELEIIKNQMLRHQIYELGPVLRGEDWSKIKTLVRQTQIADSTMNYALALVRATRYHSALAMGCSPRATMALVHCAQALAFIQGETYVKPDHIKKLALAVMEHRFALSTQSKMAHIHPRTIIAEIMDQTRVPIS